MSGSNALQITDPNAGNPLANAPSWADAYGNITGSTQNPISDLQTWLAAQRAKSAKMGLWDDATGLPTGAGIVNAGQQYGNALLAGSITPGVRFPPGLVDVGDVTAHINPSKGDLAKMMAASPNYHLRALSEGPNLAIWPAYDATHAQMATPLGFTKNAASRDYFGREGPPDDDFSGTAGRFSIMGVEK